MAAPAIAIAIAVGGCGQGVPGGGRCQGTSCPAQDAGPGAQAGCTRDPDCGDGTCNPDGTCAVTASPTSQGSACAPNPCGAGFFCANGACLPEQAQCKAPDPQCIYVPQGSFEPPVRAFWWPWMTPDGPDDQTGHAYERPDVDNAGFFHVMMTPVVIRPRATDATPAIVFNAIDRSMIPLNANWLEYPAVMRAISGLDGAPLWTAPASFWADQAHAVNGNSSIAAGDCKGDGEVCFVTGGWDPTDAPPKVAPNQAHRHGGLVAFGSDGRPLWVNREMQVWWGGPVIARLLGPTGPAQIVVGNGVVDGATGKTLCAQTAAQISGNGDGTLSLVADLDLDGAPEIVTGNNAYKLIADAGSPTGYSCRALFGAGVRVTTGSCAGGAGALCGEGFPAVASFAGYGASMGLSPDDPHPQIVVVSHGYLRIHDWTGGILLAPIPLPDDPSCGHEANQGGAPTIADFDGDGLPEIGIAGQGGYLVWKPGVGFLWRSPTRDCSSNTGSSVFDFEGKGQAKAVYGDQCFLRIYDGKTGATLIQEKNASCTAYEMPIVADTDGTGRAKIVVPSNNLCSYDCDWGNGPENQYWSRIYGVKVLASPTDKWVNTRSVWNQHAYHVTNVNVDGTLPWPEPWSWAKDQSNSFRQNVQGKGVFSAPDLSVCDVRADLTDCRLGKATARVTVYNGGALVVRAGVSVRLYADGPAGTKLMAEGKTSQMLRPGDTEVVELPWAPPSASAPVKLRAVIDEPGLIGDCHPENNAAQTGLLSCPSLG